LISFACIHRRRGSKGREKAPLAPFFFVWQGNLEARNPMSCGVYQDYLVRPIPDHVVVRDMQLRGSNCARWSHGFEEGSTMEFP
jgi:hypothetical protein